MFSLWENFQTNRLRKKVLLHPLPEHIAIITDGNGRWAQRRGLPRIVGHRQGVEAIRRVVEETGKIGVKYLTLYSFSTENWKRPKEEVQALMGLFEEMAKKEAENLVKNGVRLKVMGRLGELPVRVQEAMRYVEEKTKEGKNLTLTLALNYGGRAEILDAVKKLFLEKKDQTDIGQLTEDEFRNYIYLPELPDPDLLIRTSGELRVSNFLLWQVAYTEIWVTKILWPDFKPYHLLLAISDYQKRQRRFGRVEEK